MRNNRKMKAEIATLKEEEALLQKRSEADQLRKLLAEQRAKVACLRGNLIETESRSNANVTSTPGHVLTTSLLRPKKIKDVVRTWYGLVGRGRNVVRT